MDGLISGSMAASASACGKVAFSSTTPNMILRAIAGIGLVLCNAVMIKYFVASLQKRSALEATVLNFGVNFLMYDFCFLKFIFEENYRNIVYQRIRFEVSCREYKFKNCCLRLSACGAIRFTLLYRTICRAVLTQN